MNVEETKQQIQRNGFEIVIQQGYVGIWRNYPSRGFKEIVFSYNVDPQIAMKSCCEKFINMSFMKNN